MAGSRGRVSDCERSHSQAGFRVVNPKSDCCRRVCIVNNHGAVLMDKFAQPKEVCPSSTSALSISMVGNVVTTSAPLLFCWLAAQCTMFWRRPFCRLMPSPLMP